MTGPAVATTTVALLVNDDRHYLLHLRDANKNIACAGQWSLPGGHPEPGESLDDAISRELLEEAGLRVPGLAPLAVIENTDADDRPTSRVRVYVGTWNDDPARLPLTEGIMLRWTAPEQIPYLTVDAGTTAVIRHHQQREPGQAQRGPRAGARIDGRLPLLRLRGTGTKTVPNVIGVHLYLERAGEILLGLRHPDSAYAPLEHHFLAGHCERESAVDCLVREAWEEAGLVIKAEDVDLVHVVHVVDAPGAPPRLQLVFRARRWQGEPQLREPDKCVSWGWWPVDALPEPTVGYTRAAVDGIRHGRLYTELGWGTPPALPPTPPVRPCPFPEFTTVPESEPPTTTRRYMVPVDVHLILPRDSPKGPQVLLSRRAGDVYAAGMWHLPSGHLDGPHEDVVVGGIREQGEETGLLSDRADIRAAVTVHHRAPSGPARIGVFLVVLDWQGEPRILEEDRCDGMDWFYWDGLPEPMVAYCRAGLDAYRAGARLAVHFQQPGDPVAYDPAFDRLRIVPDGPRPPA